MGFLSKLLNPKSAVVNPGGYILGKAGIKQWDPGSKAIQWLAKEVNPRTGYQEGPAPPPPAGLPGSGDVQMPALNQPALQLPQLQQYQIPQLAMNPDGYGFGQGPQSGMPFIRDRAFANTLGPLTQQNYGLPFISPYQQQAQQPGAGGVPYQPSPPQQIPQPGFGQLDETALRRRIGISPIRGAVF